MLFHLEKQVSVQMIWNSSAQSCLFPPIHVFSNMYMERLGICTLGYLSIICDFADQNVPVWARGASFSLLLCL